MWETIKGIGGSVAGGLADMFSGSKSSTPTWSGFKALEAGGNAATSAVNNRNIMNTIGSGISNIGQFAADNKELIDTGLAGLSAYGAYQSAQDQKKYAQDMMDMQRTQMNRQEAERQRQIDKEKEQQNAMLTGFSSAGL